MELRLRWAPQIQKYQERDRTSKAKIHKIYTEKIQAFKTFNQKLLHDY